MFFKKDEDAALNDLSRDVVTSIIGKDMQMVGDISFRGKLRLDGKAEGNIQGDYLILGDSGIVIGDIMVNTLVYAGRAQGNVSVKTLQVIKSGTINGKVETTDLAVESGAALNGEIKSRAKELRLMPGAAIPQEEWDAKVQEAAASKIVHPPAKGKQHPVSS
ncbi:MAG TPA: polymer-forming cytoskeletal protein [Desulfurivibrionaceae bacterium]|nr:polymer-forming cytoskeletal protein [Desulfurivibrionaceae bacterium]